MDLLRLGKILLVLAFAACHGIILGSQDALGQSNSNPLRITQEVWSQFQDYLAKREGLRQDGAFLVVRSDNIGVDSSYSFCPPGLAVCSYEAIKAAGKGCRENRLDCVLFALSDKIIVAYEIVDANPPEAANDTQVTAMPETAGIAAPPLPDREYESPLPDGTIVLSSKSSAAMEEYLDKFNAFGSYSRRNIAVFYVSADGKQSGAVNCVSEPSRNEAEKLPRCPEIVTWSYTKPDMYKIHQAGRAACAAGGQSSCVLLFVGNDAKRKYQAGNSGISGTANVTPPAPQPELAPISNLPPDPVFESPLPDGTIVLSPRTQAEMETYLEIFGSLGQYNRRNVAVFYVSLDGKHSGAVNCVSEPNQDESALMARCPETITWSYTKPDLFKIHRMARAACEAGASSQCVLLFDGDRAREKYKTLN
jgi:hypothetical protein